MNLAEHKQRVRLDRKRRLGKECRAYRLDGHPNKRGRKYDLAKKVKLSRCNCCDYFMPLKGDQVAFVEITEVLGAIQSFMKKHACIFQKLNQDDKGVLCSDFIVKRNVLKLYGSMVVLCSVMRCCKDAKDILPEVPQYHYWAVWDKVNKQDFRILKNIRTDLENQLGGILGPGRVVVLPSDDLQKHIERNVPST